jgi:uncharacterized membrane protein
MSSPWIKDAASRPGVPGPQIAEGREAVVAWYTLVGGIIGALVAAVPGFIDMLSLPWRTKRIALIHMSINLTVVALYVVNAYLRQRQGVSDATIWLSVLAVAMLVVSGWLGGKLVYVHGVAVDPAASGSRTAEQ